ncbi:MAG: glycosyltransferase family 4 protein, partial [Candidatus Omnitrophica bacterium]|nr:glycosyltransferase family 4 protein [Candidatus Omnitrophota bacterium]
MKVLMDFRKYDGVVGGVEQGAIQVTKYLGANGHAAVLICKKSRLDQVKEIFKGLDNLKIIPLDVNTHSMTSENALLDSTTIQDIAVEEKADVIHFFYNWSFPENKKVPCVLTVHDVIPFTFREAQKLFINLFKYKPGIRKACRLNDIITTVSEFSRQDIAQKVGVSLSKIKVVHNGLREPWPEDKDFEKELAEKLDLFPRFILNVGGIHERKNIVRLIGSFASLVNKHGYAGKLVITGKVSGAPYQEKMKKLCDKAIADNKMTDRVIFTGFTSEKELDSLFRMADLLIYPSLYEGFGIPI